MSENSVKYNINQSLDIASYAMPQFLFSDDFRELSNNAKILYMLLKNRQELSTKSNFVDENGNIFLIITRDEIGELLNLSMKKVIKSVDELKKSNLIDEIRQGMGKANKIYLLRPESLENTKTCQNGRSRMSKMADQRLQAEFKSCQNGRSMTTSGIEGCKNENLEEPENNIIEIDIKDTKKTLGERPSAEVSEIDNISDVITKIINNNFNITITKKQIKQLIEACNGDLDLLNEKVELLKKQTGVKSAVGWLIKAMKDDYKVFEFSTSKKKWRKSKINNYKGHNWDYNKLEELEQQYLEKSLKSDDTEEIKSKINKVLQETFGETFDNDQLIKALYRCKYDFDIFKIQLEALKTKVIENPKSSLFTLYLSITKSKLVGK